MAYRKIIILLIAIVLPIAGAVLESYGPEPPCLDGEWVTAGE